MIPPDGGTGSGEVQRAWGSGTRFLDDVEVDHGGGDVGVAEEVLDGADVGALFEDSWQATAPGHEALKQSVTGTKSFNLHHP